MRDFEQNNTKTRLRVNTTQLTCCKDLRQQTWDMTVLRVYQSLWHVAILDNQGWAHRNRSGCVRPEVASGCRASHRLKGLSMRSDSRVRKGLDGRQRGNRYQDFLHKQINEICEVVKRTLSAWGAGSYKKHNCRRLFSAAFSLRVMTQPRINDYPTFAMIIYQLGQCSVHFSSMLLHCTFRWDKPVDFLWWSHRRWRCGRLQLKQRLTWKQTHVYKPLTSTLPRTHTHIEQKIDYQDHD